MSTIVSIALNSFVMFIVLSLINRYIIPYELHDIFLRVSMAIVIAVLVFREITKATNPVQNREHNEIN